MRQSNKHIRPGKSYLHAVASNAARPFHWRTGLARLLAGHRGAPTAVRAKRYCFPPSLHYLYPGFQRAYAGTGPAPAARSPRNIALPDGFSPTGPPIRPGPSQTPVAPAVMPRDDSGPNAAPPARAGEPPAGDRPFLQPDRFPAAGVRPQQRPVPRLAHTAAVPGVTREHIPGPAYKHASITIERADADTPAPADRATPPRPAKPAPSPARPVSKATPDTDPSFTQALHNPLSRFPKGGHLRPDEPHEDRARADNRPAARSPDRREAQAAPDITGRPSTQALLNQLGRCLERENFQAGGAREDQFSAEARRAAAASSPRQAVETRRSNSPLIQRRTVLASGAEAPSPPTAPFAWPARAPAVLPYRQSMATPDRAPATDKSEAPRQTVQPAETANSAPPPRRRTRQRPSRPAPAAFWERSYLGRLHIRACR